MATLPGTWQHRVSAGTGWPGIIILWLDEIASLICNFYLSVAALVWKLSELICQWGTLACCWDVKQPTNNSPHHHHHSVCYLLSSVPPFFPRHNPYTLPTDQSSTLVSYHEKQNSRHLSHNIATKLWQQTNARQKRKNSPGKRKHKPYTRENNPHTRENTTPILEKTKSLH